MKRRALLALAPLVALLPLVPARAEAAPPAACDESSWVGGAVDLCGGELVYRDYVYDDYGADTGAWGGTRTGVGTLPAGEARYPVGADNTADLLTLRLRPVGDQLAVTFQLNTLYGAGQTKAVLAVDTDDDPATGGGPWPGVKNLRSAGWDVVHTFATGDPVTNAITGTVALPAGTTWRVQAVVAQADGTVMNVAFRGRDEGRWFEDDQAASLRTGDVSGFGHVVAVADLLAGVTRPAPPPAPGLHERVYESDYTVLPFTEGMTYGTEVRGRGPFSYYQYFGRYQPYSVYVPEGAAGPRSAQLFLHGTGGSNNNEVMEQAGFQADLGDARNRILVSPLGRGTQGYFIDVSERDVLDVLDDALAHYAIDPEQVFVSGYSMGGYGAYRMAMLHPDRFAGYLAWAPFTGDVANPVPCQSVVAECASGGFGNVIDLVGNLRHVPGASLFAGGDYFITPNQSGSMTLALRAAGNPFVSFVHPAAEHLTFGLLDDWEKESAYSAGRRRVADPARVTYRTDARWDAPEYGIAHRGAYWVSGIEPARPGYADVDLTSSGCGTALPVNAEEPPGTGTAPVPWVSVSIAPVGTAPVVAAARLEGTLANVAEITVDRDGACLPKKKVAYDLTTDGPVTVHLGDGASVSLPGAGRHQGVTR